SPPFPYTTLFRSRLELELLEQVVELDVLDRQLEAGIGGRDLVGHRLERLRLRAGPGAVGMPDGQAAAQAACRAARGCGRSGGGGCARGARRCAGTDDD